MAYDNATDFDRVMALKTLFAVCETYTHTILLQASKPSRRNSTINGSHPGEIHRADLDYDRGDKAVMGAHLMDSHVLSIVVRVGPTVKYEEWNIERPKHERLSHRHAATIARPHLPFQKRRCIHRNRPRGKRRTNGVTHSADEMGKKDRSRQQRSGRVKFTLGRAFA